MADGGVRYEHTSVKAVRGTGGRSIARWQEQGWELVGQDAATLCTTLSFRKVEPALRVRQLVLGGVVLAVLLAVVGVGAALEGDGDSEALPAVTSTPSVAATATPEVTEPATPRPSGTASSPAQPGEPPEGPLTDITVDELLDRLNTASGGISLGDRFRFTGELFWEDAWGVGATGDHSVHVKAKDGKDDLLLFVDRSLTTGWGGGTRVEVVVEVEERTIDGETSDGWLEAQSVRTL